MDGATLNIPCRSCELRPEARFEVEPEYPRAARRCMWLRAADAQLPVELHERPLARFTVRGW